MVKQKTPQPCGVFCFRTMSIHPRLIYVHDPMCSWCWGFRPALQRLRARLPRQLRFERLLGGLAADSDQPMPMALREQLQDTWRRIQQRIPGTEFNFDFWTHCTPRRATYPACRAVIAARRLAADREDDMILAIQQAYYTRALNPSDEAVLVRLAEEIDLPGDAFAERLRDTSTEQILRAELARTQALGVSGFPTLILETGPNTRWPVPVEYTAPDVMLDHIGMLLDA